MTALTQKQGTKPNRMKFSATLTLQYPTPFSSFSPGDFDRGLQWVKDSGFDGVEVCISHYEGVDVPALREKISSCGLGVSTLSTGQARALEGISLLHTGEALKKAQERLCQHIDAAAVLGSKVTLGLLRGLGSAEHAREDKAALARNMEGIIRHASDRGVTVLLECINRYETALFNDVASTVDFIRNDLGNPACMGILWDLFHANIEDPTFEDAVECLGDRLRHVHIADSNRFFPGYGHTDFTRVGRLLVESGFSDYCSFECFNRPSLEVVLKEAKDWIAAMRAL